MHFYWSTLYRILKNLGNMNITKLFNFLLVVLIFLKFITTYVPKIFFDKIVSLVAEQNKY